MRCLSLGLLTGTVAIAFATLLFLQQTRLDRELRAMSVIERQALYARTLETLSSSCEHPSARTLIEYCRDQSNFIKRFPECDRTCQTLAARRSRLPWH